MIDNAPATALIFDELENKCRSCGQTIEEQIVSSYDYKMTFCNDLVWLCYECDSIEEQQYNG